MLKLLTVTLTLALATPVLALGPIPTVPSTWPADGAFDGVKSPTVSSKNSGAVQTPLGK